jgi:biopolymer transport protein ExbD
VNREGDVFWGLDRITDNELLVKRLKEKAVLDPQPEVQIRGDLQARYESIGRVVFDCQRAGIVKVNFIIEPPVANASG